MPILVLFLLFPLITIASPSAEAQESLHQPGQVVWEAGKRFYVLNGKESPPEGDGYAIRYVVLAERHVFKQSAHFSEKAERVLSDGRGWARAGIRFVRVNDVAEADIKLVLARPKTVDTLCKPLDTGSRLSCAMYGRANFNVDRWKRGAATWGKDVDGYHFYLIQHEVGHLMGLRHAPCTGEAQSAPIMMPQTKRVGACTPNGTPHDSEIETLKAILPRFKAKIEKKRSRRR